MQATIRSLGDEELLLCPLGEGQFTLQRMPPKHMIVIVKLHVMEMKDKREVRYLKDIAGNTSHRHQLLSESTSHQNLLATAVESGADTFWSEDAGASLFG